MGLFIPPAVVKQMSTIPKADRERLINALKAVAADLSVRQSFVRELVDRPGHWRVTKGVWRAVYKIENGDVVVVNAGHRREVYR